MRRIREVETDDLYVELIPDIKKENTPPKKRMYKEIIKEQKNEIEELQQLTMSQQFELEVLRRFIRISGIEDDLEQFKKGFLAGLKKYGH